jgi:hypothetical protein
MTDRSEAIIVRWRPADGAPRRLVFEPRESGFLRVEEVHTPAGEWREVGREAVDQCGFENVPAECVDAYPGDATPAQTTLADPRVDGGQQSLGE